MTDQQPTEREAAASDESATIEWEGLSFTLPATVDDWDPETLEQIEKGSAIATLRGLFGDKRYDEIAGEFREAHGRKWKVRDLNGLFEVIVKHYGFESRGE